ncbi:CPBP family intramembrane glutamic endopeptidase [Williamsia sp. 1135]|uniref:CPBP family intramembrane glutamic endopeptidase n=1 Tax=Williamsia sp. 1135 TaxID=1889262 RepID=UPI000A122629|nr:CPBP family intramembrane glutamic endopeptidase [Williamsia sp. 1135]ORM32491.1 hypothetical protein BFL43_15625 [Williamsia sp. 1135]
MKYAAPENIDELWRMILVPVAASLVLVYAAVAWLGWWRPVWIDDRPVQRWVIVVPVLMAVSIVIVTDYAGLIDHGLAFTLLLLLGSLMVGLGEETMFRGIGVTCFRKNNLSEGKVALWSTLVFGLAHSTNLISEGPKAFAQVGSTIVAGYFLYLIRRRTGGLLFPVLIHGLWDFSLTTGKTYAPALYAILTSIMLAIILFIRRHHIEPDAVDTAGNRAPAA